MKKILVIRFSSIGDIVLTTPVIRCLKKQLEDCEIHYLTRDAFKPVLQNNPHIDKIITIKNAVGEAIPELKNEAYSHIVDLHKNFRSLQVRSKLKVKTASFPKLNLKKWLLVNFKINLMPDMHIVDRYFKAVENLGVVNDGQGLDYFLSKSDVVGMEQLPESHRDGYIAMVIGGKHKTKQLPGEKATELLSGLDYPALLLGGAEERDEGESIEQLFGGRVYSVCGKYSINQSAWLVKQARVVITGDTGLMHIAAAFGKPVISIWGNTVPALGMYPYMPGKKGRYGIYEVNGLSCRPCSKIGYNACPKKHFRCMKDQDIDAIIKGVNDFYRNIE
jgi:ADP-heptose:LPS heptosyltransferase